MATIRKRLGKYHTQVRKNGKSITKSFTNRKDALKWAKEQEVKIEQGSYISKKETVTLSFLLSRWEQEVLKGLKSWSVERYKVAMLQKKLGHLTLDNITSTVLVKYRDQRLNEVANQTVKHELGLIRRAMKKGIEWGYISSVPFLTSPSLKGQARTRRLKQDELNNLIVTCEPYLKHVVILLIETAMRRGELATLALTDIDIEQRLLHLRGTKNGEDRIVPISSRALASVQYLMQNSQSEKLLNMKKSGLLKSLCLIVKKYVLKTSGYMTYGMKEYQLYLKKA